MLTPAEVMDDLLPRLKQFQIAGLTIDITWVYGPAAALPGRWDCQIKIREQPTALRPTTYSGIGATPHEALFEAHQIVVRSLR